VRPKTCKLMLRNVRYKFCTVLCTSLDVTLDARLPLPTPQTLTQGPDIQHSSAQRVYRPRSAYAHRFFVVDSTALSLLFCTAFHQYSPLILFLTAAKNNVQYVPLS
jgi:hypothetical protein